MSTCWRLSNEESGLPKAELVAALAVRGIVVVEERPASDKAVEGFCLSDGRNYLWAHPYVDGKVSGFESFAANDPRKILEAIEEICEETVLSEHDDGFHNGEDLEDE